MPIRNRCSLCDEQQRLKMASAYWSWTWPTGDRRAYKQLVCAGCAGPLVEFCRLSAANDQDCFACRTPFTSNDTAVTVWATVYFPNRERIDAVADFHARCFEGNVESLTKNAVRLADRGSARGAPRPDLEKDPWEALGLARAG